MNFRFQGPTPTQGWEKIHLEGSQAGVKVGIGVAPMANEMIILKA